MKRLITLIIFVATVVVSSYAQDSYTIEEYEQYNSTLIQNVLAGTFGNDRIKMKLNIINTGKDFNFKSRDSYHFRIEILIDGTWNKEIDDRTKDLILENESIKRTFTEVTSENIQRTEQLVRDLISARDNDIVIVESAQFDRSEQFQIEDKKLIQNSFTKPGTMRIFIFASTGLLIIALVMIALKQRQK